MRKNIKKIMILVMLVLILITQYIKVFATNMGDSPYLYAETNGYYTIQYHSNGQWIYVTYNVVRYTDDEGISRIAYCLNSDLKGIGGKDGYDGYNVSITEALSNVLLWRVYRYGYPYSTPEQLGVETEEDAYLATKQAGYWVLKERSLEELNGYFRAGQTAIAGQNLEETNRRGQKVVSAIYNLVYRAYTSDEKPENSDIVTINQNGTLEQDSKKDYYSQKYTVTSATEMLNYAITNVEEFPVGTYVADINGNEKRAFSNNEQFKIMIPKEAINENATGKIEIQAKSKTYPVFYGASTIYNTQNYAITVNPFGDIYKNTALYINAYKSKININKADVETSEKLSGVVYNVKYADGGNIGDFTTDQYGKIAINNLKQGKVVITETVANNNYILDETPIEVNLEYDSTINLELTNERQKGQIEVYKTDSENNEIKLKGVEFEVINANGENIETITTNDEGYAITSKLPIGEYYIKEIKTDDKYILNEEMIRVDVTNDIISKLNITNELAKPSVDIEKDGIIQTTANQEIKYDFNIKNTGNVPLSNYTWFDYLPTDYIRVTKMTTGTYNQDLNYSLYYKTNKNDYKLLKENLNTQVNNYIDFTSLKLEGNDEYVTEIKTDFGTVDVGFESITSPYIFAKVNSNVKNDDTFANNTRIEGYNKTHIVWDENSHMTKIYDKKLSVKKLPRTGK